MIRVHPDGRKDYFLECAPGHIEITGHPADFQKYDKDGNIVVDTKRDRNEKISVLADLINKHRTNDKALDSMLRSWSASVRDPNNELVHLYEIRDTLHSKFGNNKKALSALKFSGHDWDNFGELCNQQLQQGRHRGKKYEALRDAIENELSEARRIAKAMIEAYL